ncbi:hypothetical protein PLESTM_001082300 [Pleodorina starrii]|nr:hypothetical protein PLESTM_001082300 [Pleodorina starrii]
MNHQLAADGTDSDDSDGGDGRSARGRGDGDEVTDVSEGGEDRKPRREQRGALGSSSSSSGGGNGGNQHSHAGGSLLKRRHGSGADSGATTGSMNRSSATGSLGSDSDEGGRAVASAGSNGSGQRTSLPDTSGAVGEEYSAGSSRRAARVPAAGAGVGSNLLSQPRRWRPAASDEKAHAGEPRLDPRSATGSSDSDISGAGGGAGRGDRQSSAGPGGGAGAGPLTRHATRPAARAGGVAWRPALTIAAASGRHGAGDGSSSGAKQRPAASHENAHAGLDPRSATGSSGSNNSGGGHVGGVGGRPSSAGTGGGAGAAGPHTRPVTRPAATGGRSGADSRDGGGGGGGGDVSGGAEQRNMWKVTCIPVNMDEAYPDLRSFAAAVKDGAASWHPLRISAALNHAAKLWDSLDRQKQAPARAAGGPATGSGGGHSASASPPGNSTSATTTTNTTTNATTTTNNNNASANGNGSGRGSNCASDEQTLRQTVDRLHAAFLPHVRTMSSSRYSINALWVCAKTGYWGAPGSTFVGAMIRQLRAHKYAILRKSNGQAHGNLWWALSQYFQQAEEGHAKARGFWTAAAALPGQGQRTAKPGPAAAVAVGEGGGGGPAEEAAAARAGGSGAGVVDGRPEEAAAAAAAVQAQAAVAASGMDLLKVSASLIRSQKDLDAESFKTQECCNILLAAARVGFSSDPEFIDHLLSHLVKHPGPFKPQAISNTIYALGELYGDALVTVANPVEEREGEHGPASSSSGGGGSGGGGGGSGGAIAAADAPGQPLPGLWAHVRALARLALRLGLQRFSEQELSNMTYGLARLGYRMGGRGSNTWAEKAAEEDQERGSEAEAGQAQEREPSLEGQRQQQRGQGPAGASAAGDSSEGEEGAATAAGAEDVSVGRFVTLLAEHVRDRVQLSGGQQHQHQAQQPPAEEPQALSLSVTTWALATIGYLDQSYYDTVVQAALHDGCMDRATPQEWGIFLWGLGSQQHQPPRELVRRLYKSVHDAPSEADGIQGSVMLPWALAVLDLYDVDVVSWIASVATPSRIAELEPQGLANFLWSLAAMPEGSIIRHAELVSELVEAANRRMPHQFGIIGRVQLWQVHLEIEAIMNGQSSTAADGTAVGSTERSARRSRPQRLGRAGRKAKGDGALGPAAPVGAATATASASALAPATAPAAVALRRLSAPLVAAARESLLETNQSNSTTKATVLQASVYRHLRGMMLGSQAAAAAAGQPQQQQDRQQRQRRRQRGGSSNSSSADGRLPLGASSDADTPSDSASSPLDGEGSDDDSAAAAATAPGTAAAAAGDAGPQRGGQVARASRKGSRGGSRSGGSDAAVTILRVEQEWLVEALGLRVDVCVWLSDGRVVVVEVDGPCHFFRNQLRTPVPNTLLRDRQLHRVFGRDNVHSVPYWKWDVAASSEQKTRYLTRLLGL